MANCQKVDFAEVDAGGGAETWIQLGVALPVVALRVRAHISSAEAKAP